MPKPETWNLKPYINTEPVPKLCTLNDGKPSIKICVFSDNFTTLKHINTYVSITMARVYDSLLSGTSGKIGRLIAVNRYGKEYIRFHLAHLRKAPSQKQQLLQQRMKNAVTFMDSYKSYACKFFGQRVGGKTRYNQAMTNLLNSLVLDFDNHPSHPITLLLLSPKEIYYL